MRKLNRVGLCVAVALAISMPPIHAETPVKIGVILPLSGNGAFLGQGQQRTLKVLQDMTNKEGGIQGRPLEFEFKDDQTSPQITVQSLNALKAENVSAILGSTIAAMCNAQAPLIKQGPFTYCLSPGIKPSAGSFMFSANPSSTDLLEAAITYLRERGLTKLGLISSTDATGQDFQKGIAEVLAMPENRGIVIQENLRFNPDDISVSAQITRIKAEHPQAVIAWTSGSQIATIFRNMVQADVQVPVLTTSSNQSFDQMAQYASFLPKDLYITTSLYAPHDGVIKYDPETEAAQQQFYAAMKQAGLRVDLVTANAWDPAMLVIGALKKIGPNATAEQLKTYLANLDHYAGVDGVYDFKATPQRGLTVRNVSITRWVPGTREFRVVSKPGGKPISE